MKNIKNIFKNITFYIIILIIFLYKGAFFNMLANIRNNFFINNINAGEINILKEENKYLKSELEKITNLKSYANYKYDLTRVSFIKYNSIEFFILGGIDKGYKENMILINEYGLVGLISKVYDDYSLCTTISNIENLSVEVNNNYGTIKGMENDYLIIDDLSKADKISINDEIYTSTLGTIKEKFLIGYVNKIENIGVSKRIYVKSHVNINNISYLYVVGDL